mgnify:CR=1 FL=1
MTPVMNKSEFAGLGAPDLVYVRAIRAADLMEDAHVEVGPGVTVPIEQGSIFGEVGLISGRPRGSTVRAAAISACASASVASGAMVMGLTTIPLSKRFT